MATSLNLLSSLGEGDPKKDAEVSNNLRNSWNLYTDWLEKKGLKGHPSLDVNDNGGKMIDIYRKEVPTTLVSRENIVPIQRELAKYRDYSINQLRTGKAVITDAKNPQGRYVDKDENLDYFMKDLSKIDGISGQNTTAHNFPETYMKTFLNNNLVSTQNQGFAQTQPIPNQIIR